MATPEDQKTPHIVDPATKDAVQSFFSKYATFDLVPAQIALEVSAPLPEILLALEELIVIGAVREIPPGRFRQAPGPERPQEGADGGRRRIVVTPEGVFINGHLAPPQPADPDLPDDLRSDLLSAWQRAFALRIVRERGIEAKTLDASTRYALGLPDVRAGEPKEEGRRRARVDREKVKPTGIFDSPTEAEEETSVEFIPLDRVAQTYVDRREADIETVRRWAEANPNREALVPQPLSRAEARSFVETEAVRHVSMEAWSLAEKRMPHLHRPDLDGMWGMMRSAEARLPSEQLSDADKARARRLWFIAKTVASWALRVEAGESEHPWLTQGGRPIIEDGFKMKPRLKAPVSVGRAVDQFVDDFYKRELIRSSDAMNSDEVVAEIKPVLAAYLRLAKKLNKTQDKAKRQKQVEAALFKSVALLAAAKGRSLGIRHRKELLKGFPRIKSTPWVDKWTAFIAGVGPDIARQTAARRLKAGPQPKPHNPPQPIRDEAGTVVGWAEPPTPLQQLEIELQQQALASAWERKREQDASNAAAAARAKRKAAARAATKGKKRRRFWE